MEDRYIHYEKAGGRFVGRSVAGISLLRIEFGVSPVHCDWTDSSVSSKDEMLALIEDNFVRRKDVSSPTLDNILFYLHVYAFTILALTRTYIKTTTRGHHQFLLLQAEQKIFTSLLLPDIPG